MSFKCDLLMLHTTLLYYNIIFISKQLTCHAEFVSASHTTDEILDPETHALRSVREPVLQASSG
jgi:hypothetical protein